MVRSTVRGNSGPIKGREQSSPLPMSALSRKENGKSVARQRAGLCVDRAPVHRRQPASQLHCVLSALSILKTKGYRFQMLYMAFYNTYEYTYVFLKVFY